MYFDFLKTMKMYFDLVIFMKNKHLCECLKQSSRPLFISVISLYSGSHYYSSQDAIAIGNTTFLKNKNLQEGRLQGNQN